MLLTLFGCSYFVCKVCHRLGKSLINFAVVSCPLKELITDDVILSYLVPFFPQVRNKPNNNPVKETMANNEVQLRGGMLALYAFIINVLSVIFFLSFLVSLFYRQWKEM